MSSSSSSNMNLVKAEQSEQALAAQQAQQLISQNNQIKQLQHQLALTQQAAQQAAAQAQANSAAQSRKRKRAGQLPVNWLKPITIFKRNQPPSTMSIQEFAIDTPMRVKEEQATWLDHVVKQEPEDSTYKRPGADGKTDYPNEFKIKLKTIMQQAMKLRLYGSSGEPGVQCPGHEHEHCGVIMCASCNKNFFGEGVRIPTSQVNNA